MLYPSFNFSSSPANTSISSSFSASCLLRLVISLSLISLPLFKLRIFWSSTFFVFLSRFNSSLDLFKSDKLVFIFCVNLLFWFCKSWISWIYLDFISSQCAFISSFSWFKFSIIWFLLSISFLRFSISVFNSCIIWSIFTLCSSCFLLSWYFKETFSLAKSAILLFISIICLSFSSFIDLIKFS